MRLAISAPQLPVNKFTVLIIEDSNTIDSELVDALPLTPLIPTPLRKPKWERRLPKLLSISALDARGTSLLLPVEIRTTDTSELHSVKALLDSRATGSFIDKDFVCSKGINTQTLSYNILVFNVDSFPNRTDLQGCRRTSPLQDSLRKDAFGRLWTWETESDPRLQLAQGPQPQG